MSITAKPLIVPALTALTLLFMGGCTTIERYTRPIIDSHGASSALVNVSDFDASLRVLTLNMAHARGTGSNQMLQDTDEARKNLDNISKLLKQQSPDVVSLQEVDYQSFWNGKFDHVGVIAQQADFSNSVSGSHVVGLGLDYGTALVSKLDLRHPESVVFSPSVVSASKGFVVSSIRWPGKSCIEVDVVSTHLDFASEDTRREQAAEIIEKLQQRGRPIILMGDFNTGWKRSNSAVRVLAANLDLHSYAPDDRSMVTFPKHTRRLDWILVSPEISFDSYGVLPTQVSDHLGVVSDLSINRDCG